MWIDASGHLYANPFQLFSDDLQMDFVWDML